MDATIKCERNTKSGGLNRACSRTVKIPTLQLSTLQKQTRTHTHTEEQCRFCNSATNGAARDKSCNAWWSKSSNDRADSAAASVRTSSCSHQPLPRRLGTDPGESEIWSGWRWVPVYSIVWLRNSRQLNLGKLSPKFLVNARQGFWAPFMFTVGSESRWVGSALLDRNLHWLDWDGMGRNLADYPDRHDHPDGP